MPISARRTFLSAAPVVTTPAAGRPALEPGVRQMEAMLRAMAR